MHVPEGWEGVGVADESLAAGRGAEQHPRHRRAAFPATNLLFSIFRII